MNLSVTLAELGRDEESRAVRADCRTRLGRTLGETHVLTERAGAGRRVSWHLEPPGF
ncbi:hypothetical protein ACFVT5_26835 [Streptomyces sp. NPDC058001]|uniref:hypothetical protein n=1 Tax=Streptomyces sp. NPDC058001 TaxID=3346300 RepID=UPI0036E7C187